jgi:3-deoxy-manno-octulosonate cytidylyltransferase (CMP-KDO synthetase)
MTKIIAIIPARYDSTRLPGKPLLDIGGKTLLQRVYGQVSLSGECDRIIVATDDDRIAAHARSFGAEVEMTFRSHRSGTDRCAQVARSLWSDDIVVNIQGDEPFIDPALIDRLAMAMKQDDWIGICSFRAPLTDPAGLCDPNTVKVVSDKNGKALYFSRQSIPYHGKHLDFPARYFRHIGLYGYRNKVLQEITTLPASPLEQSESLEQLRWLENGFAIHLLTAEQASPGIDTPEDLERARKRAGD